MKAKNKKQVSYRNIPLNFAVPLIYGTKKPKPHLLAMLCIIFATSLTGLHYLAFADASKLTLIFLMYLLVISSVIFLKVLRNVITRKFGIFVSFRWEPEPPANFNIRDYSSYFFWSILVLAAGFILFLLITS